MAQQPWFMQSGGNRFHHDQAMHDLPDGIRFLSQLQEERIHLERTMYMLSRTPNRVPDGCLLDCPGFIPIPHINVGIGPSREPVWPVPVMPKSKGTGVFFPTYDRGSHGKNGHAQQYQKLKTTKSTSGNAEQKMKPTKASWEKEVKHTVSCQTSPEMLLPKEWPY